MVSTIGRGAPSRSEAVIPPARPVLEAFRRALSSVVANPLLILAPVSFAVACVLSVGIPVGIAAFGFMASMRRPWSLGEVLEEARGLLSPLESPLVLLVVLVLALAILLLLTLLAAWIRAGVTGCLLEIDAHAGEGLQVSAFRHSGLGPAFRTSARRLYGRFFALVNLYGMGLSVLLLLLILPAGLGVYAATSERYGFFVAAFVLFGLFFPPIVGASAALRVVYLVACRIVASDDVDALEAVARATSWTRVSLSRVVLMYLLSIAGGVVVGLAFEFPRLALQFLAGRTLWLLAAATGLLLVIQMLVGLAYDLVVSGCFVVLWPPRAEGDVPPILV